MGGILDQLWTEAIEGLGPNVFSESYLIGLNGATRQEAELLPKPPCNCRICYPLRWMRSDHFVGDLIIKLKDFYQIVAKYEVERKPRSHFHVKIHLQDGRDSTADSVAGALAWLFPYEAQSARVLMPVVSDLLGDGPFRDIW